MKPQLYRIPAFPLNLILFPGEEMPLRIFEPRYKQLIDECISSSKSFGIPFTINGELTSIGSEVEVVNLVGRNANDDMVITIKGKSNFNTIDFFPVLPNKLYGGTISEKIDFNFSTNNPEIAVKVKQLKLNISPIFGTLIINDGISLLDIAKTLMLSSDEKFKLLSISNLVAREQYILNQLRFVELIRSQESKLENNFQLN
jgi:hypothetical protein